MDFSIDRLNRQSPLSEEELQLTFEGIESSEYLTYQPDTVIGTVYPNLYLSI